MACCSKLPPVVHAKFLRTNQLINAHGCTGDTLDSVFDSTAAHLCCACTFRGAEVKCCWALHFGGTWHMHSVELEQFWFLWFCAYAPVKPFTPQHTIFVTLLLTPRIGKVVFEHFKKCPRRGKSKDSRDGMHSIWSLHSLNIDLWSLLSCRVKFESIWRDRESSPKTCQGVKGPMDETRRQNMLAKVGCMQVTQ